MPASRAGLFESLRQLLHTALSLGAVRLELLATDLEIEKLRLIEVALRALVGLMLLGLGLLLLVGFLLLLLWDGYRLPALGVLTLLCLGVAWPCCRPRNAGCARASRCSPRRGPSSSATRRHCARPRNDACRRPRRVDAPA